MRGNLRQVGRRGVQEAEEVELIRRQHDRQLELRQPQVPDRAVVNRRRLEVQDALLEVFAEGVAVALRELRGRVGVGLGAVLLDGVDGGQGGDAAVLLGGVAAHEAA